MKLLRTFLSVLVRTPIEPGAISPAVREKIHELSAEVRVKFTTMEALNSEGVAAPLFRTLLLGIFAGLAVGLALAGVDGVMSYVVGQRSNEIGLRMALGARPRDAMRLILRPDAVARGRGHRHRSGRSRRRDAIADDYAFRSESERPGDLSRRGRLGGHSGSGCELHSRAARNAR
jgi:hypothetical protein